MVGLPMTQSRSIAARHRHLRTALDSSVQLSFGGKMRVASQVYPQQQ